MPLTMPISLDCKQSRFLHIYKDQIILSNCSCRIPDLFGLYAISLAAQINSKNCKQCHCLLLI
jgi:hypothetical protein